jgi:hypothetical protein
MRRIAIALVVALGVPASAQARVHTIAPPGNSGVGQYLETVPTAGGAQPTNTVHPVAGAVGGSKGSGGPRGGAGAPGGGTISSSTQRALAGQGSTGAADAALAQATAPPKSPKPAHGDHRRTSSATSAASTGGGSSPASSVLKSLTGSTSGGGLGPLLPSLLIVSVLGAAVLALLRRRRTS